MAFLRTGLLGTGLLGTGLLGTGLLRPRAGASLRWASLTWASLTWASLIGASLIRAALSWGSLALALLPLAGCGYHAGGAAAHLPAATRILDVPTFQNHTQAYHVELTMTQAVLKEFESRTAFRTVATDDAGTADAVLHGDITTFSVYPLTYDSTTNQSSSYEITITARVKLVDRSGRVLYANDKYLFRQQYESTQDLVSFIQEDSAAMQRLSRDFAQNLVADVTESF